MERLVDVTVVRSLAGGGLMFSFWWALRSYDGEVNDLGGAHGNRIGLTSSASVLKSPYLLDTNTS